MSHKPIAAQPDVTESQNKFHIRKHSYDSCLERTDCCLDNLLCEVDRALTVRLCVE